MTTPSVSVLIVSWNARPLLERCLPSVVATDYENLEIVLVDNASTDNSAEWTARTFPQVRIVSNPENWGFCRGNNAGIRATTSEYVVLLNNDVEVPPDWLGLLVARAQTDPRIAAIQPKLLQYGVRSRFEYAGASGGYLDRFGYPFARGRMFFTLEEDRGQYDDVRDVDWATGAALLLRRSALDEVGLLDEQFEFHMEEIDLCWRLRRAGFRVLVEPASRAFHIGAGSLSVDDPRKVYYNFRNSLLMLYKNLPPRQWRRTFPIRLLLDGVAGLRALLRFRFREAASIVRAYADAHRMKASYRDHRPESGPGPSYRGSIVADYFLRRRRTFGQLPFEPLPFEPLPFRPPPFEPLPFKPED